MGAVSLPVGEVVDEVDCAADEAEDEGGSDGLHAEEEGGLRVVESPGLVDAEEERQEDGEALRPLAGARGPQEGANGWEYAGVGALFHAGNDMGGGLGESTNVEGESEC